jgi:hypothetical protein
MAVVKYTGNMLSLGVMGYRFFKKDRRAKIVDDKFVTWLKGPGSENKKFFEIIQAKGLPGETPQEKKEIKAEAKATAPDPGTGGTVTINLEPDNLDANDKPDLPAKGFASRGLAISFAIDELELDIENDVEVAKRYKDTLALGILNQNLVEDYTKKFGPPEWLGGGLPAEDDNHETASTGDPADGIEEFDTASGEFKGADEAVTV